MKHFLLAAVAALTVSACGTTVPLAQRTATPGQGLGGQSNAAEGSSESTGTGSAPGGVGTSDLGVGAGGSGGPATSSKTAVGAPGGATGTSGSSNLPSAGGPGPRSPLKVGVIDLASTNDSQAAIGIDSGGAGSGAEQAKALVRYLNAHGGLNGRRIQVVEFTINVADSSYESDFAAACAKFTQDNHVDAVVETLGDYFSDNFQTCLERNQIPSIQAYGAGSVDVEDYRKFPSMFTVGSISANRKVALLLKTFTADGYLTPKNKVGVIVEDCAYNTRAYDATFAPLAKAYGLAVTRYDVNCLTGKDGLGNFESQVGAAELRFRSAGVDRVTFVTSFEDLALLSFTQVADTQGYKPSYALTTSAQTGPFGSTWAASQLPMMRGVGWQPDGDLTEPTMASSATRRCRAAFKAEGVRADGQGDYSSMDLTCAAFFLLETGLVKSGGQSGPRVLVQALESLGRSVVSPIDLTGATLLAPGRHDEPTAFAVFAYQTACSCFRYVTRPAPIPQ